MVGALISLKCYVPFFFLISAYTCNLVFVFGVLLVVIFTFVGCCGIDSIVVLTLVL